MSPGARCSPRAFTTLVENTVDAYTASGDGAVEDVRRILADLRRQYDEVRATQRRQHVLPESTESWS